MNTNKSKLITTKGDLKMEINIWDKQFKRWINKDNVKHIYQNNDSFKVEFKNGKEHTYSKKYYELEFLFSDDWSK